MVFLMYISFGLRTGYLFFRNDLWEKVFPGNPYELSEWKNGRMVSAYEGVAAFKI